MYSSPWVGLRLADVEIPGGERFEHHVVRVPREAAGCVVHDPGRGVLLLWRHRFITDTWGWEIPAGAVDEGETPAEAAAREVREETGWRPGPVERLVSYQPSNGLSDQRFNIFLARDAEHEGDPVDFGEAERIAWRPPAQVRDDIAADQVADGLSLTALAVRARLRPARHVRLDRLEVRLAVHPERDQGARPEHARLRRDAAGDEVGERLVVRDADDDDDVLVAGDGVRRAHAIQVGDVARQRGDARRLGGDEHDGVDHGGDSMTSLEYVGDRRTTGPEVLRG